MSDRKLPNLIIAGVNKAGTTSLFTYLSQHKDICGSTIKETNYFVPLLYGNKLSPIDNYIINFKDCNKQSKYLMEATPRYIYGGEEIANAIHDKLDEVRIIILLRDPIKRLFSYYKHMKDNVEIPKNMLFDDYVTRAIKDINELRIKERLKAIDVYAENIYIRGLAQGFYYDYLTSWCDKFGDDIKIYFFEDLKSNPLKFMDIVCRWLSIDPSIYESATFTVENRRIYYKSKIIHNLASRVNDKFEVFLRRYYPLKVLLRNFYYFINESNGKKENISENTKKNLEILYKLYNKKLLNMLCIKGYSDFPDWLRKCQ